MVEIKSISKSFKDDFWKKPNVVVNDLSFSIMENKITGFVGENGSGKSTTIKLILGLLKPDTGHIEFSSSLGTSRKEVLSNIGYLPENPRFFENLKGGDFLMYMGKFHQMDTLNIKKRINYLGEVFDLSHAFNRKIGKYSKGMRQKIGYISSILHNPKLLILDEPLSGLDPRSRALFKESFSRLKNDGVTVFLTSHILEDLYEVGDEVISIKNGLALSNKIDDEFISIRIRNNYPDIIVKNTKKYLTSKDYIKVVVENNKREKFIAENNISGADILEMTREPYFLDKENIQ